MIQHSSNDRVVLALQRTLGAPAPIDALAALTELRAELDRFEREQVHRALDNGASFGAVGRALGISRQAAHRRYRERPTRTTVVSDEVRALLSTARQEAARAGANEVECEHVALALAGPLSAPAVNLEAARVLIAQHRNSPPPTKLGPRLRALLVGRPIDVDTLLHVLPQDPTAKRILDRLQA